MIQLKIIALVRKAMSGKLNVGNIHIKSLDDGFELDIRFLDKGKHTIVIKDIDDIQEKVDALITKLVPPTERITESL